MKKIWKLLIIGIIGAQLAYGDAQLSKVVNELSNDSTTRKNSEVAYKTGVKFINFIRPWNNGRKAVEVKYVNGKREGLAQFFTEAGSIFARGNYKNDIQDGVWEYYSNGRLYKKIEYKNGIYNGEYITYNQNGNKDNIVYYNNGKKKKEESYYLSGGVQTVVNYSNDKKNGAYLINYPNGKKYMVGSYENDLINGKLIYYYENGKIMLKGQLKNGNVDGIWEFYGENGELKYQGEYNAIRGSFAQEFNRNAVKVNKNN